ncbi:hypothetical protein [Stappia sp.]|uniref:hypothetical protein n=1 Tax=Stappia sp. TaxID=1870903 RepID=UPI003C79721B
MSISWKLSHLTAFAVTAVSMLAHPAYSAEPRCPLAWAPYVSDVQQAIARTGSKFPVLFVGPDGKTYDCLNYGVSPDILETLGIIENDISRKRDGGFPLCSPGNVNWPSTGKFYTVWLPYNIVESRDILCKDISKNLIEHIHDKEK